MRTLLLACCLWCSSCAGAPTLSQPGSGALLHIVVFWFRPEMPEADRKAMVDLYLDKVQQVPGVDAAWLGRPAGTPRDVVDNSYNLLVAMRFADEAAANGWQTHPVHKELLDRFSSHFAKVVVYDARE